MQTSIEDCPLIILAGGLASRLGVLSKDTPKYLMPIDGEKKFADYHLEWVRAQGFKKVILAVGVHAQKIQDYVKTGSKWDLEITYSHDGPKPIGTGGALKQALQGFSYEWAAFTYGDTLLKLNCKEIFKTAQQKNAVVLMTVYLNQVAGHTCNADLDSNGGLKYSKTHPSRDWKWIDYGFSFFNKNFFPELSSRVEPFDLADCLESVSQAGSLQGYPCKDRFWEIGSPIALEEFRKLYPGKTH